MKILNAEKSLVKQQNERKNTEDGVNKMLEINIFVVFNNTFSTQNREINGHKL